MDAFQLQAFFNQMETGLGGKEFDQMRYNPDGKVYLLALAGDKAPVMVEFMRAVGKYVLAVEHNGADPVSAKAAVQAAFEKFLSQQSL